MHLLLLTSAFAIFGRACSQTGVTNPLYENCGPSVLCVNRYANVLP